MSPSQLEASTRVVLRPIANPLPLGFLALAVATVLLAGVQLRWLAPDQGHDVGLILIAFVFPLQLLVCAFGYLARDVVAGTAMGILAGTWLSVGLVLLTSPPGASSDALGLFLLLAALALVVPAATSATGKLAATLVLGTTAARLALSALAELTADRALTDLAGAAGLVLGLLAVYAAAGMALEDALGRTILPLGLRARGEAGISGAFGEQLRGVEHQAGVRQQL